MMALPFDKLRLFRVLKWAGEDYKQKASDAEEVEYLEDADIVSSKFRGAEIHMPVLDIDIPATATFSSARRWAGTPTSPCWTPWHMQVS